ncbi:MAG: tetratricopeptide repeat protein, partial [bacterium]
MSKRSRRTTARIAQIQAARLTRLAPFLVAAVTLLAFLPVLSNGFVAWDDDKNFLDNTNYRGLGLAQLGWMWSTFHLGHYVPLSWMSLGLDYVLWGMNPVGYHLTNLILHAVNAVLVYHLARRLFGLADPAGQDGSVRDVWAAVAAALLFSIHPLRVESVAWATERRDVLSCLFFLSSILAYLRAVERGSRRDYLLGILAFACALLSKATAVTLPAVLLVLNVYPLKRVGGTIGWTSTAARSVYREIAPFAALAAVAAAMTFVALQHLEQLTLGAKLAVSAYSVAFYLLKTAVPTSLSPLYEMPSSVEPFGATYLAAYAVVVALAAIVWTYRRRTPALAAAAVAFIVVLFPLLGLVQNGPQIAADRYTYYAAPALTILAAGVLARLSRARVAFLAASVAIAALGALTWRQTMVWHDSGSLWAQVLRVQPQSSIARNNEGNVLMREGRFAEAVEQYEQAVTLAPRYAEAHNNLGVALARMGRTTEAVDQYRRALAIQPSYAQAQNNWGIVAVQQGNAEEAMEHYRLALAINPTSADAHTNWGNALVRLGRPAEAVPHYEEAVTLQPNHADAHL